MEELKETLNQDIVYIKNRLENKSLTVASRQYLLGRLTSLEIVLEKLGE